MKVFRLLLAGAVVLTLLLTFSTSAAAAVRRYAVIVGDNHGDAADGELRYAESDAARVYDVLKDLGGFEPADMVLLRGEGAPRAESTLIAYNDRIRGDVAAGQDVFLFVYYSGHADSDALHLAGTRLELTRLEQLVRGSAATFRVLAVDACRSGALTRLKGGAHAAAFGLRIDEHLSEQGLVLLSASAANEDAQESDALQGSFFTHHFVSALLGAADADGDGRVTLEEAYKFTYDATLRSTSQTWAGLQHPTFRYDLRGAGRIELTAVAGRQARALLLFPPGRTYLVTAGAEGGAMVGEVPDTAAARQLNVPPGRYFVRGRTSNALLEGPIDAAAGATVTVSDDKLTPLAYARLVRKGVGIRRAAQQVDAGYQLHTALKNSRVVCQGGYAGYDVHLEEVSLGVRAFGCTASESNAVLRSTVDEIGGEARAVHVWDLPRVSVDLGLAAGAAALAQHFTTAGDAPSRVSPAAVASVLLGARLELGRGFAVEEESAFSVYIYPQSDAEERSLGPYVAFRQSVGLGKAW